MTTGMKFFIVGSIMWIGLGFPFFQKDVTISLPITENRPFAGVINGELVGTDLCCKYWLHKDQIDSVMTWRIEYSLLGAFTSDMSAEHIN